jgi:signal transduction histidine kinase
MLKQAVVFEEQKVRVSMRNRWLMHSAAVCGICILAGHAGAQAVDPRNPAEWRAMQTEQQKPFSRWLPLRIRQLEGERRRLLARIGSLPQHDPKPQPDHLGCHFLPWEDMDASDEQVGLIVAEFKFDPRLAAIALAPAFVPESSGKDSYAFPKRFKIEIMDRGAGWVGGKDGKWVVPAPPYKWVELVNWMDEDFPDPGPYPVFFAVGDLRGFRVRVTVARDGQAGTDYCALGEMYLFRRQESGELGDNMMVWDIDASGRVSNSFSQPPLWDKEYLRDGVVGLGMPLSEETAPDKGDFMVSWKQRPKADGPVQIVLDLGAIRQVGRVQLWPAEAPHGMAIPHFGFPGRVSMELSTNADFSDAKVFTVNDVRERMYYGTLLNIITAEQHIRYIRLTFDDLSHYMGRTILGLGEIRVSEFDEVSSMNCNVSATGIPPSGMKQLPRLVDGFSRNRRILREAEWIRGLAMRRPLDRRLARVEEELVLAHAAWDRFRLRASFWGGGLVCAVLLAAMGLQRLQRRRVLNNLKNRITRDLHDEVGSSLGSITLATRRMEDTGAVKEDLAELSLMAREASASLRDVVWLTDQETVRLPGLLKKLVERAERVLIGMELTIHLPDHCPDRNVPLPFKRHLLMFFKEAVHNCARHSRATRVNIDIDVTGGMLSISLKDNGCGFDPLAKREGWGVDSMGKRAKELGGSMDLQSAPGRGTTVVLKVPLNMLDNSRTEHSYQTSN